MCIRDSNLTLQLMQDFGAKAAWTSPNSISVAPQLYQSIPFKVESDWSAASYWSVSYTHL